MRHMPKRWLIPAIALVVMLAATMLAGPLVRRTLAASGPPPPYLALGDSVAFGYSPLVDPSDPHNFSGYPTPAAQALKESLTNASCPGETSSHFIDLTGSDHGCGVYRANFPLHVGYSGAQLAFADSFLQSHPATQVVSINIGANDLFVLQTTCGGNISCIRAGLPGMLATLAANLNTIYGHIRNLDGYHNALVALTYYSLNYTDPVGTAIISEVNTVVAQVTVNWGGKVADGFGAFKAITVPTFNGDSCAAGLLILVSSTTCNIHPSYPSDNGLEPHADTGRAALGQAIVNAVGS
jgi:GDSL-like Lipase/Acylhydrolase family